MIFSKSLVFRCFKAGANVKPFHPTKELTNESFIAKAIWQSLKDNDPEAVVEILEAHLIAVNKLKFSKEANIPRASHTFCYKCDRWMRRR